MSDPISALAMAGLVPAAAFITDLVNGEISGRRQKELLQMQMDYNTAEAQKARDFTQNMLNQQMAYQTKERAIANTLENTAISRQAADMQRVGINPLMSASFSGLGNASPMSAPSGVGSPAATSPSALPLSSFRNDHLSNLIMSIPDLYLKDRADKRDEGRLQNETNESEADVEFTNAKTVSEKIEALNKQKDLELKDVEKNLLKANITVLTSQNAKNLRELGKIDAETAKIWSDRDLNEALRKLKKTEQELVIREISKTALATKHMEQMFPRELKQLEEQIKNLQNDRRVANSSEVRQWLGMLSDRALRLYEIASKPASGSGPALGAVVKFLK